MKVVFWSPVKGHTALTSNMTAISIMASIEYRLKILVTHNKFYENKIDNMILTKDYLKTRLTEVVESFGLDGLNRILKYKKIDKETFDNFVTTIINDKYYLLAGTSHVENNLFKKEIDNSLSIILEIANNYYDLIFFEVESGIDGLKNDLIQDADLVIVNLNQSNYIIDEYFSNYNDILSKNKLIILGMYNKDSVYQVKNIQRQYKNNKINIVPYCRAYADACNEGKAVDYLIKNLNNGKRDQDNYFIKSLKETVKTILMELQIDIDVKRIDY